MKFTIGKNTDQPRVITLNYFITIFMVIIHVGACLAPFYFTWQALTAGIFLYWLTGSIGICLGYHRLLSHRGFKVNPTLEKIIATIGALAFEGGPLFWVSGHRQHHSFTEDIDKDPYSTTRGFFWSHMGWILFMEGENKHVGSYASYAKDLARTKYYRWLDRSQLLCQFIFAAVIVSFGELVFDQGLSFLIFAVCLRLVWTWHCTWLINSACHKWGYKNYKLADNSSNLWWAAILTFGEGWHNNHHQWPKCAKAGDKWWEIDTTYWVIAIGQKLGIVTNVALRK